MSDLAGLIIEEAASYFGVSPDDVRARRPGEASETATRIAIYLIRDLTDLSLVKIAALFREADHKLVLATCQGVESEIAEMRETFHLVNDLLHRVRKRELGLTYDRLAGDMEQLGRELGPIVRRSETYARELTNDLSGLDEIRLKLETLLGVVDRLLAARRLAEEVTSASDRPARAR